MTTIYFDFEAFSTHTANISINQILHNVKFNENKSTIEIEGHTFQCDNFVEGSFLSPHKIAVTTNPKERSILYRMANLDNETLKSIISNETFSLGETVVTSQLQEEMDNDLSLKKEINSFFLLHSVGCFGVAGEENIEENLLTLINRQGQIVSVFRHGDKAIKITTSVSGEIYTTASIIELQPFM